MSKYLEQINRARRYFARFKQINDGTNHDASSETYFDDIYTFFTHCYHIKDYLINDRAYTAHSKQEIENHITNTPSLALCADICNGLKHLHLNNPRSGSVPDVNSGHIHVHFTDSLDGTVSDVKISCKVTIKHNGNELDAFEVATEAMDSWELFLA